MIWLKLEFDVIIGFVYVSIIWLDLDKRGEARKALLLFNESIEAHNPLLQLFVLRYGKLDAILLVVGERLSWAISLANGCWGELRRRVLDRIKLAICLVVVLCPLACFEYVKIEIEESLNLGKLFGRSLTDSYLLQCSSRQLSLKELPDLDDLSICLVSRWLNVQRL